jgi:hypothetical protein
VDLAGGFVRLEPGTTKNSEGRAFPLMPEVRAMLGHVRLETTQVYTRIRPAKLKRAVAFYEAKALDALGR